MRIKDLIRELLNEDMEDDLYLRYEDGEGKIVYFTPEGICFDSDRFQSVKGVKYTTVNLTDVE